MSLADRMLKLAKKTNSYAVSMDKLPERDIVNLPVYMLNVAFTGRLKGGFYEGGTHQIVGDSKCFKTCYGLIQMAAYLDKYKDAIAFFLDSEGGASKQYMETYGVDQSRVIHLPIDTIEDLRSQIAKYLDELQPDDKAFFFIDSLGLLASKKEVEDALNDNDKADMTRAKVLTSFWRIATGQIKKKKVNLCAINHYYETMEMYSKPIIKGGKASEWSPDDIWIVTRSQIKDGKDLAGWSFNIKVMKSRTVREGAKIPIEVTYDKGINPYSGLLEVARATGHVVLTGGAWYTRPSIADDKKWRKAELGAEFWEPLIDDESFNKAVTDMFVLNNSDAYSRLDDLIGEDVKFDEETGEILD